MTDIIISKYTYIAMCIIGCCFQFFNGFVDLCRSILFSSIQTIYELDNSTLGLISAFLGYAMILFSLLATFVLSKTNIKVIHITALSIWLISFALLDFIHEFGWVVAILFFLWLGTSFSNIGANAVATTICIRNPTTMVGLINFVYSVGLIVAPYIYKPILIQWPNCFYYVYSFFAILVVIILIYIIFTKYQWTIVYDEQTNQKESVGKVEKASPTEPEKKPKEFSFVDMWKDPLYYVFLGLITFLQLIHFMTLDWSLIYLKNVMGWQPTEEGSTFIQIYTICYCIARFVFSFIIEPLGSYNTFILISTGIIVLSTIGFCLNGYGVYTIAFIGFFTGPTYPTMVTMAMEAWGTDATMVTSYLVSFFGIFKEILNYVIGLLNDYVGIEWGFRMMVPVAVLQLILAIMAKFMASKRIRQQKKENHKVDIEINNSPAVTETPVVPIVTVEPVVKEEAATVEPVNESKPETVTSA